MRIWEVATAIEPIGNLAGEIFDPRSLEKTVRVPYNDPTPRNPAVSPTSGVIMRKDPMIPAPLDPMFEALDQHSVLYHYTGAWHLAKIFAEKRISFTVATGSDIQAGVHNAEKIYFLSCTRSKIGRYSMAHEGANAGAVLVLNRDWLQHNLRVRPVDYWGREFRKADPRGNEMEERVYSREPYLPLPLNAKDLILSIHLYVAEPDERYRTALFGTVIGAKQLGIPLFAYQDKRAWLLQDTRRTLPSTQLVSILKSFPNRSPGGSLFRRPGDFGGYIELFSRPVEDRSRLTKAAKRVIRNLTPYYLDDVFRSLEADIHNTRSPGSIGHDNLIRFMQFLQQNGFNNIKPFIEFLSQKWYGTR